MKNVHGRTAACFNVPLNEKQNVHILSQSYNATVFINYDDISVLIINYANYFPKAKVQSAKQHTAQWF